MPTDPSTQVLRPQLSHRGLMAVGAVIALAFVIIIFAGTVMYLNLRKHEHELRQLVNPTTAQFHQQILRGIRRCLLDPECHRLFPNLIEPSHPRIHKRTTTRPPRKATTPPASNTPSHPFHRLVATGPQRRPAGRHPRSVKTRPEQRRPHNSPATSTTPNSPPNPPPSPSPSAPIGIIIPLPLSVCSPVVQVNRCPSGTLAP